MTGSRGLFLVVDQGSTNTKAALIDSRGRTLDQATSKVTTRRDGDRVEHDAAKLAAGVRRALDRLIAKRRKIAAIGLTCQRSTCLLWRREDGTPLTPALSWQDRRQHGIARSLRPHERLVARRTGLRLSPHYAALKLRYLLEELDARGGTTPSEGEIVGGTLDAFLMQQLTGRPSTEPGQAGRTLLYNLEQDGWDPQLASLFEVPLAVLPTLGPSAGHRGDYRGIPVTALAGDQQAALLGHGGWRRGVTAAHLGTGAFVLASTGRRPKRHPRLLTAALATTARTKRFQLEGSVNSAGSAIDWVARLTASRLSDWADRDLDAERAPLVFPAFAGAGAPWWNPRAQTVFSGIGLETTGADLMAGVLNGVAMRILDCVETLAAAGEPTRRLRLSGKATRLESWVQLLADAGRVTTEVAGEEETGLEGIARLARAGLEGTTAALGERLPAGAIYRPRWSRARAQRHRRRWRRFARQAIELSEAARP